MRALAGIRVVGALLAVVAIAVAAQTDGRHGPALANARVAHDFGFRISPTTGDRTTTFVARFRRPWDEFEIEYGGLLYAGEYQVRMRSPTGCPRWHVAPSVLDLDEFVRAGSVRATPITLRYQSYRHWCIGTYRGKVVYDLYEQNRTPICGGHQSCVRDVGRFVLRVRHSRTTVSIGPTITASQASVGGPTPR